MKSILLYPYQYTNTTKGFYRNINLKKDLIIKSPQGIQRILGYSRVNEKIYHITYQNGEESYLNENLKVLTLEGKKNVSELQKDDYVYHNISNVINRSKEQDIDYSEDLKGLTYNVKIPEKNSIAFSSWIGICLAFGVLNHANGTLSVELTENRTIADQFVLLSKELFHYTPERIQMNDRVFYYIKSKVIFNFLKKTTGFKRYVKKIPELILRSSKEEQQSFVKALCLKKYNDGQWVLYSGSSKSVIDFVHHLLTLWGYQVYIKKLSKQNMYYLKLKGKNNKEVVLFPELDPHLDNKSYVRVPQTIYHMRLSMDNPSYNAYKTIKRQKRLYAYGETLTNIGIEVNPDEYYNKIKSIEISYKNMIEVYLSSESNLFVNNLVVFKD